MRIGVEAGEVLVDVERASGPRDRMLTGDAVNVAARLQSAADPGRVIVGPTAHEATRAVIEYRELTPLTLKGKAEPVPAWDALRVRARQRGERPELGMEAKLVGRDEELAVLVQTFQRVQADRRPALVTVVGPAGVGKSRLGREFERHIDGLTEFVYWRRGRCMAYGNTAYSALADAVKAQCEIFDDDATEVAWKKVNEAVESLFGDTEIAPQIGALVGAGEPGAFSREDLFDAWRRFFERMAARYPLVLVFEDIHWADDALLDFTEYLADWAQGPIMVLTLARPELFENRPAWGGGKRNAVSIFLDPLSADESSAMLADLLAGGMTDGPGARGRGAQRRQPAVRRGDRPQADRRRRPASDGRRDVGGGEAHHRRRAAALDPGPDRDAAGRPARRREGGAPGRRRGRTRLLVGCGRQRSADGRSEQVRDALGRLRVKELVLHIDPPSLSGELEFTFRHALIRDGAYESLPEVAPRHEARAGRPMGADEGRRPRRRDRGTDRHPRAAGPRVLRRTRRHLAATHPGRDIGVPVDPYGRRPGQRARPAGRCLPLVPAVPPTSELVDASVADRAAIARAPDRGLVRHGDGQRHRAALPGALELYEEAGDDRGAGWAESSLVMIVFNAGRAEEASAIGDHAVQRLEPLGETPELAAALRQLGQFHWRSGDSARADAELRRAADIAERVGALDVRAAAMHDLGVNLAQSGHAQEAIEILEEAFVLAKEANDANNLQRIYNNLASTLGDFGSQYARAREIGLEGLAMAHRGGGSGWTAWMAGTVCEISVALGDLPDAEVMARDTVEYALSSGDAPLTGMRYVVLGWILLLRGKLDEAEPLLAEATRYLEGNQEPQITLALNQVFADAARARGRDEEALAHLRKGAEVASRYNVDQAAPVMLDLIRIAPRPRRARRSPARTGDPGRGEAPRTRSFAEVADGLMAQDPNEAVRLLGEACAAPRGSRRADRPGQSVAGPRAGRTAGGDRRAALVRACARAPGGLRRARLPPRGRGGTRPDLRLDASRPPGPDPSVRVLAPAAPDHRPVRCRTGPPAPALSEGATSAPGPPALGDGFRIPNPLTAAPIRSNAADTITARWNASVDASREASAIAGDTTADGSFSGATCSRNCAESVFASGTCLPIEL